MAGEVATAWVTLLPSFKGGQAAIAKELDPAAAAAGKTAGGKFSSGFGSSLKGMGAALGVGLGIGAVTSFFSGAFDEAQEANKATAQTQAVIKSTGGAAKVTADQIGALATSISNKTGIDDEAIQAGQNMLLTFKNIRNETGSGNDIFDQSTQAVTNLSAAMGKDMSSSALLVGKALNDPIAGMSALSRAGVQLTDDQKETIRSLVDTGDTMGAQKILLGELESQFGGAAEALATPADKAKVTWANFKESIGTALMPTLNNLLGMFTKVIDGLMALGGFVGRNKTAFIVLAGVITALTATIVAYNIAQKIAAAGGLLKWVSQMKVVQAATKAWTAIQWLLNAAMSANPLTLIVIGIALLIAAIVLLWNKSDAFRAFIIGAWEAIKTAFGAVVDFITVTVPETFQKVLDWVKELPGKLAEAGAALWDWVAEKAQAVWDSVVELWNGAIDWIGELPGKLAEVASGVWTWLTDLWEEWWADEIAGWQKVFTWFGDLPGELADAAGDVFGWLLDKAEEIWEKIKDLFSWDNVSKTLGGVLDKLNPFDGGKSSATQAAPGVGGLSSAPGSDGGAGAGRVGRMARRSHWAAQRTGTDQAEDDGRPAAAYTYAPTFINPPGVPAAWDDAARAADLFLAVAAR